MSLVEVDRLLQLSKHHDKDERFMATNDMITALDGLDNIDRALQSRITNAILYQLDDQSPDVQSVAVKCLSVIIAKFSLDQIVMIAQRLCELIFVGSPELRDVYSIGIRTIINSLPSNSSQKFCATLTPFLLAGMRCNSSCDSGGLPLLPPSVANASLSLGIQLACIELSRDVLRQFGHAISEYHETFLKQLLLLLSSDCEFVLQKRVVNAFAALARVLSPDHFEKMFSAIMNQIEHFDAISATSLYNYIQCIGVICRVAVVYISPWLPRVVPFLIRFSTTDCRAFQLESQLDSADDLRETCLQAMESIFKCCSNDASPFYSEMLSACCSLAKFDPNVVAEMDTDRLDEGEDIFSNDGLNDGDWDDDPIIDELNDDEQSFKVRKSALLALSAFIINSRKEHVHAYFLNLVSTFYICFGDRDITVKTQAFSTYGQLLKTCPNEFDNATFIAVLPLLSDSLNNERHEELCVKVFDIIHDFTTTSQISHSNLISAIPILLRLFQCSSGFLSIRHGVVSCIRTLLCRFSMDPDFSLRQYPDLVASLPLIAEVGLNRLACDSAQMRSDAIDLCGLLTTLLPADSDIAQGSYSPAIDRQVLLQLYNTIRAELMLQDVDQRIKDSSINTISIIVSKFGNYLDDDSVSDVLQVIDSRLNNEVTRPFALDALIRIAERSPPLDLGTLVASPSLERLCSFLRKTPNSLRYKSARTILLCLTGRLGAAELNSARSCITTIIKYIDDQDSQLCDIILFGLLDLTRDILRAGFVLESFIEFDDFISRCTSLLQHTALPNTILNSLLLLLVKVATNSPPTSIFSKASLLQRTYDIDCSTSSVDIVKNQSAVIAGIACCEAESDSLPAPTVVEQLLLPGLRSTCEKQRLRCLQAIGTIGKSIDLRGIEKLPELLIETLDDKFELCKLAASVALGEIGVGSNGDTLPRILKELETNERHRYFALNSFRQMLVSLGQKSISLPDHLFPLLMTVANSDDEGVRNTVSHCLGLLCCTSPEVKKMILAGLKSPLANVRSVMIGTLRYFPSSIDIFECLDDFVDLVSDDDTSTRRHALMVMNALLKDTNRKALLAKVPDLILPHVVLQTEVDPSLIRTVDFGPFKQRIDEGIPLRRAAFSCLETLALNHPEFIEEYPELNLVLGRGLSDEQEVQFTVYHILIVLCSKTPDFLLSLLPSLVPGFLNSLKDQLRLMKADSTHDTSMIILRTAMRLFAAIQYFIPKATSCKPYQEFIVRVGKTARLAELMESVSLNSTN